MHFWGFSHEDVLLLEQPKVVCYKNYSPSHSSERNCKYRKIQLMSTVVVVKIYFCSKIKSLTFYPLDCVKKRMSIKMCTHTSTHMHTYYQINIYAFFNVKKLFVDPFKWIPPISLRVYAIFNIFFFGIHSCCSASATLSFDCATDKIETVRECM